ncbi:hypothetical protein ACOQFO_12540 [Ureibacillus sp. MALMAid1270]|uniref:hypothetical protein n=1 Tax=Ureibacillus sp. MALMAid1270 TaxID=3411629 RepID=UPI003BA55CA9
MKNKCIFSILLLILIVSLLGCNWNEKSANHYYLSFTGESKTWKLIDYEVVITPESLKAGNGTLQMKNKNKFIVESFP